MKKQYFSAGIVAVVIATILGIWLLNRPDTLCSMNHACSEPETGISNTSFASEADGKIKISFTSSIKNGDLKITLYDSAENVVEELDQVKEMQIFLTLEHSDTYTLEAEYENFIGNFKIAIDKVD